MKKNTTPTVRFAIDFPGKKIIGTKASFSKASKGVGPEYEELAAKVAAHPDFELTIKEQEHKINRAKRSYEGLDFKFMENYIATFADAAAWHKKYKAVKQMAKDCGCPTYPLTKKWFLENFGSEEDGFDMAAAKERITNFRIIQAEKLAAEPLAAANTAVAEETI